MLKSPEEILKNIQKNEVQHRRGKLKIFFGMCAGVGKTYSMLLEARTLAEKGHQIVIGCIETHGRQETEELVYGLEQIEPKIIEYRDSCFPEFDIDAAVKLKPEYILVDELAHSNIEGAKHKKRYQDVIELLENGINVFTTLNVQHIESRSEAVEKITGIKIYETVPDSILELAEDIELVDIPTDELLNRLKDGKVYLPERAKIAAQNFFRAGNLISLREMALRLTAEKVDSDLLNYMNERNISGPWKAGDRLMVAIGSSPSSAELIRWTRRMAFSLKAPWYAVYVNTGVVQNDYNRAQIEKNLRLAKELGADVVITADIDLVDGLLEIAKRNNITQIIIGKPRKYNIFNYLKKNNYVDRLIQESGDIDIYIVRPETIKSKFKKHILAVDAFSKPKHYFYSILMVIITAAICFPFSNEIGYQSVGLILLLNVLLQPFFFGRGPVIVSALLNAVVWNFFFIPPQFTLVVDRLQDILTILLNLVIALTSGMIATKLRTQKLLMQKREKVSLAALNFTKELSEAMNKDAVIYTALKHIDVNFDVNAAFINDKMKLMQSTRDLIVLDHKEISIAKWVFNHNKIAGKFTDNLPDSSFQYYPVASNRANLGVVCIACKRKPDIEDEQLINHILTQTANVFEKEESIEKIRDLKFEDESKKLYNTLIDSISHEFRTPIAVISGSSSVLFEQKVSAQPELVSELAQEIFTASQRLDILVENLLDITRLESGHLKLKKQSAYINDILNDVVLQLDKAKGSRKFILELDNNLPPLELDMGFIRQAFFNILHNDCIYTPENTVITIKTIDIQNEQKIIIADNGNGADIDDCNKLFTKFYRIPGTKTGGTGLGLSIAKGFIETNNGKITAKKTEPHGLTFEILFVK